MGKAAWRVRWEKRGPPPGQPRAGWAVDSILVLGETALK